VYPTLRIELVLRLETLTFAALFDRFFSQTKYPSFQRQLNLYGFKRFAHGKDKGAYYHFCFVKGHPNLVRCMTRVKVKGNKVRSKPTEEPDFYNPLWKNHFGTTVPSELKAKAFHKVDATPVHKSVTQPFPLATFSTEADTRGTNLNGTPYVDILPAPTESAESIAPVSDEESSWDSIDLEALGGDLLFFDGNPFHFEERDDPYFTVDGEADPIGSFFVDQVSAGMAP